MLEKARQAERLIAERSAAQERFERYRTAVTVSEELAGLADTHPSPNPLPVLSQTLDRLRALHSRMTALRAMLSGEVEVNYELTTPEPTWRPPAAVAMVVIVVGFLLAVASLSVVKDSPILLPIGIGLVVLGFVIAWFARRQRTLALDFRAQKQLAGAEIDRRLRGRSQLEQELKEAEADSAVQLERLNLPDIEAAEALLAAEEAHVAKIAQADGPTGRARRQGAHRDAAQDPGRGGPGGRSEDQRAQQPRAHRERTTGPGTARIGGPRRRRRPGTCP